MIEIPTAHGTAYDAKHFDMNIDSTSPMVTQQRTYIGPVWYPPER